MKKFWINVSPVSGKTYVGRINKAGNLFLEKEEVPDGQALEIAVAILKERMEEGFNTLVIEWADESFEFTVKKNDGK